MKRFGLIMAAVLSTMFTTYSYELSSAYGGCGEYWICGICGAHNSIHLSQCKECGSSR